MQPYNPTVHAGARAVPAPAAFVSPQLPGVAKASAVAAGGLVPVPPGHYIQTVQVGGSPVAASPAAHAPPPASAPPPSGGGGRGQFWNLPRFQPPCFEGANGVLPCPDSPGSSSQGSRVRESDLNPGPACTPPHRDRAPNNGAVPEAPLCGSDEMDVGKQDIFNRYPIGALVEYKSRSSGTWILSHVEGYDEKTGVYRLTVQPNAKPERIRPHYGGVNVAPGGQQGEQTSQDYGSKEEGSRPRSSENPGNSAQENCFLPGSAVLCDGDEGYPDPAAMSVDALLRHVNHMQMANAALQKQLATETALKEQYYSQMCSLREQLQRSRDTPR